MKYDERDIMFARMSYESGKPQYEDYYTRHPEKKEIDDTLRNMPNICGEGTATYHPINGKIVESTFEFLSRLHPLCQGDVNDTRLEDYDKEEMTKRIKGLATYYDAKLVGITKMENYHYYSHRGRQPEHYGEPIDSDKQHPYGIVFAVEMDQDYIYRAPQLSVSLASTKGYIEGAIVGMIISHFIRSLGYEARNHMDGNYMVVAPLVARDAGLGQLGRQGLLLTKEYGSRVRLGVVTTNIPLMTDAPIDFGLTTFCTECGICSRTCPGKAISKEDPKDYEGVQGFKINHEECYRRWRSIGTDCGICIANCPFSDYVDLSLIDKMKDDAKVREKIIKDFKEKYPIRPYLRGNPDWM